MATTPPAAKVSNDEYGTILRLDFGPESSCLESMQIDIPPIGPGDEADVESEGGMIRSKSKSHTPKDAIATPKPEPEYTNGKSNAAPPVKILDDDDDDDEDAEEDGDEETFAVEKVLSHRISKKLNVSASFVSFHCMYADNC